MTKVLVASAVRTPVGAFCGKLSGLSEQQLGAAAMSEAVRRAGIEPSYIDEVIAGIAKQTSKPSNGARHALLLARLPDNIPAYTVQRQSASGLQAIVNGSWAIRSGEAAVVLAGGMESMSQIPFEIRNARYDFTGSRREIIDAIDAQATGAQPVESYGLLTSVEVVENYICQYGIAKTDQEEFARASLQKAEAAAVSGNINEGIHPLTVKQGKKEEIVARDELLEKPALLAPPADGAAMCLLVSPPKAAALDLPILAEIVAIGIAAADPRYPAMAAVTASKKAMDRAELTFRELDVIELNESSAAECLAVVRQWESWGINRKELTDKLNPLGGALAIGNPWGAAGAMLVTRSIHELRRRGGRFGLVAMSAEGGQGMAMIIKAHG